MQPLCRQKLCSTRFPAATCLPAMGFGVHMQGPVTALPCTVSVSYVTADGLCQPGHVQPPWLCMCLSSLCRYVTCAYWSVSRPAGPRLDLQEGEAVSAMLFPHKIRLCTRHRLVVVAFVSSQHTCPVSVCSVAWIHLMCGSVWWVPMAPVPGLAHERRWCWLLPVRLLCCGVHIMCQASP
jgi:hypothetical protein